MDNEGKNQVSLTKKKIILERPEFSSAGRYLTFWTIEGTDCHFWIMNIDGTGGQILSSGKERPIEKPNPYLWSLHTDYPMRFAGIGESIKLINT